MAAHRGHVSLDLETIEGGFASDGDASSLSLVEVRRNTGGRKDRCGIGEAQRRRRLLSDVVQTLGFFVIELLGRTSFEHSNKTMVYSTWSPFGYWCRKPSPPKTPTIRSGLTLRPVSSWTFPNDGLRRVLAWLYRSSRQTPGFVVLFLKEDPSGLIPNNRRDSRDQDQRCSQLSTNLGVVL